MTIATTPGALAEVVAAHLGHSLVAFDVDGVLAPIVEHADEARLYDDTIVRLTLLAQRTDVAIVSGRSLESLDRLFGFPPEIHVIGSHGLESRDADGVELDDDEQYTLDQLEILGMKAVEAAGDGAWLEFKPASVVVHTRSADPELADRAVTAVERLAAMVDGAQLKRGHHVVELLARAANKGAALLALADGLGTSPVVYLGDDVTDEEAFALMGAADISIRVGHGDSVARYRLDDLAAVAEFIDALASVPVDNL
jgi:trehalose-phosphatase